MFFLRRVWFCSRGYRRKSIGWTNISFIYGNSCKCNRPQGHRRIASLGFGSVATLFEVVIVARNGRGHCGSESKMCLFWRRVWFCSRGHRGKSIGRTNVSFRSWNSCKCNHPQGHRRIAGLGFGSTLTLNNVVIVAIYKSKESQETGWQTKQEGRQQFREANCPRCQDSGKTKLYKNTFCSIFSCPSCFDIFLLWYKLSQQSNMTTTKLIVPWN